MRVARVDRDGLERDERASDLATGLLEYRVATHARQGEGGRRAQSFQLDRQTAAVLDIEADLERGRFSRADVVDDVPDTGVGRRPGGAPPGAPEREPGFDGLYVSSQATPPTAMAMAVTSAATTTRLRVTKRPGTGAGPGRPRPTPRTRGKCPSLLRAVQPDVMPPALAPRIERVDARPIGIFDSGAGGLTVLHECLVTLPHEDFLYLGDGARCPYGPRPHAEIRRFAHEIAAYLEQEGVKLIVAACNAATSAALPALQESLRVPIVGVSSWRAADHRRRRGTRTSGPPAPRALATRPSSGSSNQAGGRSWR